MDYGCLILGSIGVVVGYEVVMRVVLRLNSCYGFDWRLVMGRSFLEVRFELFIVVFFELEFC